jgi:hypothetical protein
MAKDLIPPPSPAGRPSSDAEAERARAREREEARRRQAKGSLWHRTAEEEATEHDPAGALVASDPEGASEEARDAAVHTPPRTEAPYRSRFGLVLGALLGIAVATLAIGAAVYVGVSGDNGAPDGWSAWKPDADNGDEAAQQIADHVGKKYRLSDGSQITLVTGGPLEIEALGLTVPLSIAMKTAASGGNLENIDGNGLMYTLNGLGPKGSIRGGKPSEQRALLLRREALELSLYTFRYVDDVDQVVVLLPPRRKTAEEEKAVAAAEAKGDTATAERLEPKTQALFFRPGDLEPQLEIPLQATIPAATPRPETIPPSESRRIDTLTRGNLFFASFQQSQDQRAYLVLDRLPE